MCQYFNHVLFDCFCRNLGVQIQIKNIKLCLIGDLIDDFL